MLSLKPSYEPEPRPDLGLSLDTSLKVILHSNALCKGSVELLSKVVSDGSSPDIMNPSKAQAFKVKPETSSSLGQSSKVDS